MDKDKLFINIEIYKKTEDNWNSSYKLFYTKYDFNVNINLVRITFNCINPYLENNNIWRIYVKGNGDIMMEYDSNNFNIVREIFLDIVNTEYINFDYLKKLGFSLQKNG